MNMKSIRLKYKKGNKPEKCIEEKDETNSVLSISYEIKINKLSSCSLSSKKLIPSVSNQAPSTSGLNYFKSMMQKSQAINKVNRLKTIVKLAEESKDTKMVNKLKTQIKDVKEGIEGEDRSDKVDCTKSQKGKDEFMKVDFVGDKIKRRSSFMDRHGPGSLFIQENEVNIYNISNDT